MPPYQGIWPYQSVITYCKIDINFKINFNCKKMYDLKRALQGKAPARNIYKLLLYCDNESPHHTIDIIARHYLLLCNELSFLLAN